MSNNGDDCYFFYYSTCTKGDSCPFRHCEAAMGNEMVCNLWQEGRCFRTTCKFRHMEITKKRKEIPCYWENQAAGCQKPHCAFFHEKARYIEGVFVPSDKNLSQTLEQPKEEPAPPTAAPLATTANPQLRSVIKTESQDPVPSPTHPPVVINPADDDEDEDDQFSEEGEDGKVGLSPRKLPKSEDSLNFGVSTLEEIRLRKALKASMKRACYPLQNADPSANREKENIHSLFRPALNEARDGPLVFEDIVRPRVSVAQRLGRKMPGPDEEYGAVPLKRSMAERLGRFEDPPQKALKHVKERLGFSAGSVVTQPESKKAPEQIRIKTLEEIKLEKAAKSRSLSKDGSVVSQEINDTKTTKSIKHGITVKDHSISHVKTFSDILRTKKKWQEEESRAKHSAEKAPGKSPGESDAAGAGPEAVKLGEVRVKTLEEIRRERAARTQAQQASEAESKKNAESKESVAKKPRLLHIKKPASLIEKNDDVSEKPVKHQAAAPQTSVTNGNNVKVKTFEEIMREKRLRKQEMEEKAKGSVDAEPCQKRPAEGTLKRTFPANVSLTPPDSSSPSSTTPAPDTTTSTQKVPIRKRIAIRTTAASPLNGNTTPGSNGAAATSVKRGSPPAEPSSQSPTSSREVPEKNARMSGRTPSPAKQTRAASRISTAEAPAADGAASNSQKKSPEHTANAKVRPKLNVKPSVMKPAVHVKPGQKRRGAERSAVAAVKPLNSASAVLEEPLQEAACKDKQGRNNVFPAPGAETQLGSAVPHSPGAVLDSSSSPLSEEVQTVPVFKQSPGQEVKSTVSVAAAAETTPVAQSPIQKTPTQPKSRRTSVAASRTTTSAAATSAVDVFDELINEFTDEHMQDGDVDPEIGEDDLLQELTEMIDS